MIEKKTSKKQLFEMMEKINPDLQINELFGFSKGDKDVKAQQAKVDQAKQEIENFPPRNLFGDPGVGDKNEWKKRKIELAAKFMPTVAELLPVLFDVNQGITLASDNVNGRVITGIIPANWNPILIKKDSAFIDNNQAKQQLLSRIDKEERYE